MQCQKYALIAHINKALFFNRWRQEKKSHAAVFLELQPERNTNVIFVDTLVGAFMS